MKTVVMIGVMLLTGLSGVRAAEARRPPSRSRVAPAAGRKPAAPPKRLEQRLQRLRIQGLHEYDLGGYGRFRAPFRPEIWLKPTRRC